MGHGYDDARALVLRELDTQRHLAEIGKPQTLNIPCVLGPPGMGKTALGRDVAQHYDLMPLIISCGESSDPTDVAGIPVPVPQSKDGMQFIDWYQNKAAALAIDRPVLLFFDEIDKAPPQVQAGLLGILGNRAFRLDAVHRGTLIMCAGNRVDDDLLANELSESLLTRVTVIEIEPDVLRYTDWGTTTGEIHPMLLGFLNYKPDALHGGGIKAKEYRMPTPRGYWEASQQMFLYPDPGTRIAGMPNWKSIVSLKCGPATGNDFWAWYSILQSIDVKKLLVDGDLSQEPADPKAKRQWYYAAVFALASELRKEVKPTYTGLEKTLAAMAPELCLSLAVQLPLKSRMALAKVAPGAVAQMSKALYENLGIQSTSP